MNKYIVDVTMNSILDLKIETVAKDVYTAITNVREQLKNEYEKPKLWFTNIKHLKDE